MGAQDARALAELLFQATSEGRQTDALPLMHQDVIIHSAVREGLVVSGRDAYVEEVAVELREAEIHEATASAFYPVDDRTVIVEGRTRWSLPEGGFADRPAYWAIRAKDDLIYRIRSAPTLKEAQRIADDEDWGDQGASARPLRER